MKKHFLLPLLLAFATVSADAENLIFNGSLEDGVVGASRILPGWVRRTANNSYGFHFIESGDAADGKRCGRITVTEKNSGYFSTAKAFRLEPGKKYRLTLETKCSGGNAMVYIIPRDSKNKTAGFSFYGKVAVPKSSEWQKLEYLYTAPAQDPAGYTGTLQIALQGPGEVRFDNVRLVPLDSAAKAENPVVSGKNLVANGSFEEGAAGASQILPNWVRRTANNSYAFHSVDSALASEGKRSVKIMIPADAAKNSGYIASPMIKVEGGKCYKLTFKARNPAGNAAATLILYDSQKRYAGFGGVRKCAVKNGETWQTFELEYFTPAKDNDGYYLKLQLELNGPGEVNFDDVKIMETVPAEMKTEFYPSSLNYEKKLVGISGESVPLIFYFFTSGRQDKFTLELEMPESFRIVFSKVVYAVNTPDVPAVPQAGARKGYQKYKLELPADAVLPMRKFSADLFSGLTLLFEGDCGSGGKLFWQISRDGKKLDSGKFDLEMLPSEKLSLPRRPVIFSWYEPYLNYLRDKDILQRYLKNIMRSGISGASISEAEDMDIFNAANFTNQRGFWQQPANNCLTGLIADEKVWKRIDRMAQNLSAYKNAILCWNFEPLLHDYYHYCPACHREFCRFAAIAESTEIPDARTAEELYPEKYMAFRCSQHNRINGTFHDICKKYGIRSGINGYRVDKKSDMLHLKRITGGVDEIIKRVDIYQAQIYALPELLWQWQKEMLEYHPETVITYTTDERSKGGTFPYSLITPELIECETLIAGIQRVGNLVLFVGYHTLDGRQISALRRALDRIAAREYMLDGKAEYISSTGHSSVRWRRFTRDGKTMFAAVNTSGNRENWSAVALDDKHAALDLEQKTAILPDKGNRLAIRLKPYEVRFFELISKSEAGKYPAVPAAEPDKLPAARTILNSGKWVLFEDAQGGIAVKANGSTLWKILRSDGAVLTGKKYNGTSDLYFRDLFHTPREAAWAADCRQSYDFVSAQVENGGVRVTFKQDLTHRMLKDIRINKSYYFTADGRVKVDIEVINNGTSAKKIAFWQHHRPDFTAGKAVTFTSAGKTLTVDSRSPANNYLSGGGKVLECGNFLTLRWNTTPEKYYFWNSPAQPVSCEMFFPAVEIAAGKAWRLTTGFEKRKAR